MQDRPGLQGLRGRFQRFRPRTRPRYRGPSFNRLIPNIMTLLGLCAGLTAVRFALEGRWEKAAALILVAAVIDALGLMGSEKTAFDAPKYIGLALMIAGVLVFKWQRPA